MKVELEKGLWLTADGETTSGENEAAVFCSISEHRIALDEYRVKSGKKYPTAAMVFEDAEELELYTIEDVKKGEKRK